MNAVRGGNYLLFALTASNRIVMPIINALITNLFILGSVHHSQLQAGK